MKKYLFAAIMLSIIPLNFSLAQSAGLNLTLAIPSGEFKEKVDNLGFGLSGNINFISPKPKSPFGVGLNLGYIVYGSESRREPLSTTIPDVFVNIDRTNSLLNFHLLFTVGLPTGRIRPYIEGLFGGSYIYTTTSVKSQGTGEEFASSTNFDDWAWSYGAGGGFTILLSGDPNTDQNTIYLDLKGRYLFGSEAEYLKQGSVKIQNGQVSYDVSRSKTDLITVHAGVIFYFSWSPQE
ncbi:Hypothetical protein IALB_2682 [Ignavibacterium album JCM 16511]|uniref:Outer membrane protein beta-barrel domain-containing protein n=1 Tax=Ignavibacterium album (strain DSM 19864 / JCM 16511 / NBRC 101810 / Mat9-16) TaxID=945713 RepID=I0AN28_IGNAJ|nr:hypothetical protein [Ignavibacterium album]AFH50385.1 Hypothetical protein IALB_2682 [Ignavibacterium album JCM 16511]